MKNTLTHIDVTLKHIEAMKRLHKTWEQIPAAKLSKWKDFIWNRTDRLHSEASDY